MRKTLQAYTAPSATCINTPAAAIRQRLAVSELSMSHLPPRDAFPPRIDVEALAAQEPDERDAEFAGQGHREAARCRDRADDRDAGHEGLLQDLEAAASADHQHAGAERQASRREAGQPDPEIGARPGRRVSEWARAFLRPPTRDQPRPRPRSRPAARLVARFVPHARVSFKGRAGRD